MPIRRRLACLLIGLLALPLVGCFNPFSPLISNVRGISSPAPIPNSPSNCIKLFEWCYNNRAIDEYRELFTDDYVFRFAVGDSAGQNRDRPVDREEELAIASNLFVGSADRPPASRIVLDFDQNLIPFPDTRPGKNGKWHKTIRTKVDLKVEVGDGSTLEVQGFALFYLVRGDSAAIPTDLPGATKDSTRWWIEGWDDETIPPGGLAQARATPASRLTGAAPGAAQGFFPTTWGRVKEYYESRPF